MSFPKPLPKPKKEKTGLKRTAMKKTKKSPKEAMKDKAWKAFSKYIRFSSAKEGGMVECYTCGDFQEWKDMQCGHWIEGHSNAVYINEAFVRPQCRSCNLFHGGRQGEFRDKIRKELGDKDVDRLIAYSNTVVPMTLEDYEVLYKHYTRLFKELE